MKNNLPQVGELLTARPENMHFETYKRDLKNQNRRTNKRRKGFLVWSPNGTPMLDEKGKQKFTEVEDKKTGKMVKVPNWIIYPMGTFVGDTKQLPVL